MLQNIYILNKWYAVLLKYTVIKEIMKKKMYYNFHKKITKTFIIIIHLENSCLIFFCENCNTFFSEIEFDDYIFRIWWLYISKEN